MYCLVYHDKKEVISMTWFGNSDEIPMIHRENPRMATLTFQDRLTINRGIMDGPNGPVEDLMLGEYTEEDRTGQNAAAAAHSFHNLAQTGLMIIILYTLTARR